MPPAAAAAAAAAPVAGTWNTYTVLAAPKRNTTQARGSNARGWQNLLRHCMCASQQQQQQ
jgi:hypothetical protein